jgi:hypothetical protein
MKTKSQPKKLDPYYVSSAGYIVNSEKGSLVARLKGKEGWQTRGEELAAALSLNPEKETELLAQWRGDLE